MIKIKEKVLNIICWILSPTGYEYDKQLKKVAEDNRGEQK
ncbi:hypothetical protein LCGC14_0465750 [marine sediment metagenome]|uniref:Uncharacterized protein n=1 Tax=marine sediment metagenome TaxID=412755 RepID=A0A0F9V0I2_9ZZZZ